MLAAVALTRVVWWTRRDFTFLRGALRWGGMMALVCIVGAWFFGWHLGTWFNLAMVTLAGGSILYDTTKVMKHYRRDRYVAEALSLFASIAFMFYLRAAPAHADPAGSWAAERRARLLSARTSAAWG